MLVRASGPAAGPPGASSSGIGLAEPAHVLDRARRPGARAACGRRHRRWSPAAARPAWRRPPPSAPAAEVGGHRAQRPLRGRQADALRRLVGERLQPLQRQRQVGAALGARQGVDLVDDDPLDAAQRLARRGGQQQVERLGRGDQDVRRALAEARAARRPACRRCACRRGPRGVGSPSAWAASAMPCQRRAQVAVDVVDERLERRDVEDAQRARSGSAGGGSRAAAGRGTTGTRPGSCRCRWARR